MDLFLVVVGILFLFAALFSLRWPIPIITLVLAVVGGSSLVVGAFVL